MKKLFTLILLTALAIAAFAQSPQKMSYQCVVRNSSGALVANQAVGMKISILQGSATGTVVFSETYSPNPQTNANGLVTVEIGGGTAVTGTFSGINWASGSFFLKTETDPVGGTSYTITGTSQLLSVPYALYSKTAANGFSGAWADIIGKPAFATVASSGSYNDLLNRPSLFSGSYNDLINKPALFEGSWNSLTGKPTGFADGIDNIDDADNSITNEIQALSISGTNLSLSQGGGSVVISGDNWGTQTAATDVTLAGNGTTVTPLTIAQQAATTGQVLKWSGTRWSPGADLSGSSVWSQSGSNIYFNSGKVGIGNSNPATYIHAHGTPVASRGQLSLSAPVGEGTFISFYEADVFKAYFWFEPTSQDIRLQNFTSGDLNLNPYGGNVGVGTNTPSSKLDVNGEVNVNSNKIINVAGPTNDKDAANKAYVDNVILALGIVPDNYTGMISDIDGNVYTTVKIGTQIWMAQNLKTTRYNDNTTIPLVTGNTSWSNLVTPGYCWYNNLGEQYKYVYGALYNWYTVSAAKLCPVGWHVPSQQEWEALYIFVGDLCHLQEAGTAHWQSPNSCANNEFGFKALPGGRRLSDGTFGGISTHSYWWTSTEATDALNATYWSFSYQGVMVNGLHSKREGHSVRCLKD